VHNNRTAADGSRVVADDNRIVVDNNRVMLELVCLLALLLSFGEAYQLCRIPEDHSATTTPLPQLPYHNSPTTTPLFLPRRYST
jgi:hypothetical protein